MVTHCEISRFHNIATPIPLASRVGARAESLVQDDGGEAGTGRNRPERPRRVHKRKVPKHKKISLVLTPDEYDDFHAAWVHARRRGTPLNTFVTFRIADIDLMTPDERQDLWASIRKKLDQYARYRGFELVQAWVRESKRVTKTLGEGEHLHVLIWVPEEHQRHFRKTATGWLDGLYAVVIKPADQVTYRSDNGKKVLSAVGYTTKAAPPQRTRYNPQIAYEKSGPIQGKRSGLSRNLMPKAIAAWRAQKANDNTFRATGTAA
jgi:hypothetical protein